MRSIARFIMLAMLFCMPPLCSADEGEKDCDGCKDHPILARYPGSFLYGADVKAFEEAALPIGPVTQSDAGEPVAPKTLNLAGKRTRLFYLAPHERSALEVFSNYKEALAKAGMSIVWTCSDVECGTDFLHSAPQIMHLNVTGTSAADDGFTLAERPRYLLAKIARPQGDVHVMVMAADLQNSQRPAVYVLVMESKPMDAGMVMVSASAIDQMLMAAGKALIYGIYFDFDQAEVKPESQQQLAKIDAVLNDHADLKLTGSGHTDTQGDAYNLRLSQSRAEAIVSTLISVYPIAPNRLEAKGMGLTSPVSDNETEGGRKKNRRVELVGK